MKRRRARPRPRRLRAGGRMPVEGRRRRLPVDETERLAAAVVVGLKRAVAAQPVAGLAAPSRRPAVLRRPRRQAAAAAAASAAASAVVAVGAETRSLQR